VATANSGAEAIDTLRRFRPEAMLLDISLPDMDGFEVMNLVSNEGLGDAGLYCVATTGHTQPEIKARALRSGFHAYLEKPITIKYLLTLLERRFAKTST